MEQTRRSVLRAGGSAIAFGALAGCLDAPGGGDANGQSVFTSFFTLEDWTRQILGDGYEVENPVDTGRMGHGWSPQFDIEARIAESDAFVYFDTPEFAWAQVAASNLSGEADVTLIDGMEGLGGSLLPWDDDDSTDVEHDHDHDPGDLTVGGLDLVDPTTGESVAYWHGDHWHGGLPDVPTDDAVSIEGVFEDDQGRVVPLGTDAAFQFDATVREGAQEGIVEITSQGASVQLHGLEAGRTQVVFQLVHDDDVLWDTSEDSLSVEVSDDAETGATEFHDPHVWVDPVLAQDVVDTIAEGLSTVYPDDADAISDNAAAYTAELASVDEAFETLVADASLDVGVIAGHDSFQYLEHRYGFDLHTPVGVSPDESPREAEIAETIEFVDDHGIDTILYDAFEAPEGDVPRLASTIVDESTATDTAPVTPTEGTFQSWLDDGWGWVEQMEEVNLPAFRKALQAE